MIVEYSQICMCRKATLRWRAYGKYGSPSSIDRSKEKLHLGILPIGYLMMSLL
jgi:hypothetical protein